MLKLPNTWWLNSSYFSDRLIRFKFKNLPNFSAIPSHLYSGLRICLKWSIIVSFETFLTGRVNSKSQTLYFFNFRFQHTPPLTHDIISDINGNSTFLHHWIFLLQWDLFFHVSSFLKVGWTLDINSSQTTSNTENFFL